METRSAKKRKNPDNGAINNAPADIDPPQTVPIPKNPRHIFYEDDEDDEDEDYVPPLIQTESSSCSSSSDDESSEEEQEDEEEDLYEDEEEEDDEEDLYDHEEDDEEDLYDQDEDGTEYLDDEDMEALAKLKKEQPKLYDRFVLAKEIIKSRELSIFDILKADISDDKRANLIEDYEILRQTQPCTPEYIEQRDKIRNMFFRYIAEYLLPSRQATAPAGIGLPAGLRIPKSDTQIEAANFRKKIATLALSAANQKMLEEKLDEFEDIEKGEEKIKLKRWLNLATQIPFDRLTAEKVPSGTELTQRIQSTEAHLNKKLFGMKTVKERLMLFLNKKLREGNSRGCNIALVGKPGVGKCLHPDTPVRLWDQSVKRAADIQTTDLLSGDDNTPRRVLSTITGTEEMYEIHQQFGDSYTVNKSHILSLVHRATETVQDIPLIEFLEGRQQVNDYSPYNASIAGDITDGNAFQIGKSMMTEAGVALPELCLFWDKPTKQRFVDGLADGRQLDVPFAVLPIARTRPFRQIAELMRSLGMRCKLEPDENARIINLVCIANPEKVGWEDWSIREKGVGEYAGFVIDGNHRFVLGDFTVTHNTAVAKSLAECLKIPFAQLSFGGVSNSEFLMGHDYTYIGSRPGEITRCMTRLGVKNGILFFDEFDKATDKKDIMSTLLHITDFSQNNEFRDAYFPELTQDLSKVWFIYSMNQLPTDPAMLDRLEVINVDEYSSEERIQIADQYLFGKYVNELKIADQVVLESSGAKKLVDYSSAGLDKRGVRELERLLNLVIEKVYFYLSNKDGLYEYPWFNKTREKQNPETGKVHIDDSLVASILADRIADIDGRNVYLSMYM